MWYLSTFLIQTFPLARCLDCETHSNDVAIDPVEAVM